MKYGPHTDDVMEVLNFLKTPGLLLKAFQSNERQSTQVIHELSDIERYRDPDEDAALIVGDKNWVDIKRTDQGRLQSELPEEVWPAIEEVSREIHRTLKQNLGETIPEYEVEEIAEDSAAIVFQRAANGIVNDSFYEALFTIYRGNGYPCGWEGEHPNGSLVVYSQ